MLEARKQQGAIMLHCDAEHVEGVRIILDGEDNRCPPSGPGRMLGGRKGDADEAGAETTAASPCPVASRRAASRPGSKTSHGRRPAAAWRGVFVRSRVPPLHLDCHSGREKRWSMARPLPCEDRHATTPGPVPRVASTRSHQALIANSLHPATSCSSSPPSTPQPVRPSMA